MAKYTTAYSSFILRANEVSLLIKIANDLERKDPLLNTQKINAMCRGAVVLLSSHLEGYIKDLGEVAVESIIERGVSKNQLPSSFFYHLSQIKINDIKKSSEPSAIAEKIFMFLDTDLIHWNKTGCLSRNIDIDVFNKGFSNPAFQKISSYFNRFGYIEYKKDLRSNLKDKYQACTNMVEHLVMTRNKIAHGDILANETPNDIENMVKIVKLFCNSTDKIFSSWFKTKYCPIR